MTYPRMNKDDYPPIPDVIVTEEDYKLVLEYIVFSAVKIEELQKKTTNPIISEEKRNELEKLIKLAFIKYDRMCLTLDDYKRRNPHFAHQAAVAHLSR